MNNIYSTLHHCDLNQCTLNHCKKNTLPVAVPAALVPPLSHVLVVPAALAVPAVPLSHALVPAVPLSHALVPAPLVPASNKNPPSVNRNIKPEIITFIDGIVEESY
jgi:hypothetical protein